MGGRFGKLGDAKRKALIRKNRLTPPAPRRPGKEKPSKRVRKGGWSRPTNGERRNRKKS